MTIYLEYVDDSSSKFWSAKTEDHSVIVRYGRIGANGRSKTTEHASAEAAEADAKKQASKKLRKGYVEAKQPDADTKPKTKAKPKASTKAKAKAKPKASTTKAKAKAKPKASTTKAKAKSPRSPRPPAP